MLDALNPWKIGAGLASTALALLVLTGLVHRHNERIRNDVRREFAAEAERRNGAVEVNNAVSDAEIAALEARLASQQALIAAGKVRVSAQCARDCSLTESERAAVKEASK